MNDLISRNELLKRFCINKAGHRIPERDCDNFEVTVSVKDIKTIIKEQPTAYNVDKVVEEIKTLKEEALGEYNIGEYNLDNNIGNSIAENYRKDMNEGKCFAYDEAIEIVKQGGVSDDVCEWKLDGVYLHSPHKPLVSCVTDENYRYYYCPVCGKKIKAGGENESSN